jgi:hypothetical protein
MLPKRTKLGFTKQKRLVQLKEGSQMATATKSKTESKTQSVTESITLTPATQRQLKVLRASRDTEKLAKEQASEAREAILSVFGEIMANTYGTDAKGKRLVAIKLIDSSERIEWDRLAEQNPELFATIRGLLADYIVPKGQGKPTVRVDVL